MQKKDCPIYLLAGSEQLLKEEKISQIKSVFLDEGYADFNFNIFYAGSQDTGKILECACTRPFLGQKRVVLVHQIEDFSTIDKKSILAYALAPCKDTVLILDTAENYLEQGFLGELCQYAQVIFCRPIQGSQLLNWVKAFVESRQKRIAKGALELLRDNLGENLQALSSALQTIIIYIGERQDIELKDVAAITGPDLNTNAFELFNAIEAKDMERALQIVDSLLKEGVNSAQIFGALGYKMIQAKNSVAFNPFLLALQEADSHIKSGRQSQRISLELLLAKMLCPYPAKPQAFIHA